MGFARRLLIAASALFSLLFISIFVYVVANFSQLQTRIESLVTAYGFTSIFATSFLADIFVQPIGPDIPLIIGLLLKQNMFLVLVAVIAGSALATSFSYLLGFTLGKYGFRKFYSEKTYEKLRNRYYEFGTLIVLIGALTPVPYVPVCWMAGIFKMPQLKFFLIAIIARSLRFIGVAYIVLSIIQNIPA